MSRLVSMLATAVAAGLVAPALAHGGLVQRSSLPIPESSSHGRPLRSS